jgi:hypothetical protein
MMWCVNGVFTFIPAMREYGKKLGLVNPYKRSGALARCYTPTTETNKGPMGVRCVQAPSRASSSGDARKE